MPEKKILVVDDERASMAKMQAVLKSYGTCETAENGKDTLELFQKAIEENNPFDFMSLDFDLPDMSGMDIIKQIRQIEKEKGISKEESIKIMMVTGTRVKKIVLDCIRSGCNDYVTKPFKKDILIEKFDTLGLTVSDKDAKGEDEGKKKIS